ncbi:MAG: FtsX-like permease family protein [Verrucomicrobiales bacterium]|nr:FtsX-like permease family protein [Verrucomicrobiales bacterium]
MAALILLPIGIKFQNRNLWIAFGSSIVAAIVIALIQIKGPPAIEIQGSELRVLPWTVMHKGIFDAIAIERQMMYLILFVIMIVGAFCIMNTMITVTVQKRGEIGLLKALGAREMQIASIFLSQGLLVGVVGVGVGMALAQLIIAYRNEIGLWFGQRFGVDFFNEQIYGVGELPAVQTAGDLLTICGGSMFVCMVAALIPAMIAAFEEPAKALRSD